MRTLCATAGRDAPPAKPKGGYRIITAVLLAAAWGAYRQKLIQLVDLRVWFAAHEMDARRCRVGKGFPRKFHREELRKITGLAPRRLRDSLRRLQDANLLIWAEAALAFPNETDDLPVADRPEFRTFLDRIPNPNRKVPVPRRILRLLAGGARPALIAAILGHLLRGLYLKGGECRPRGRVKASWIAHVFGVDLRRVKQARQELILSGWIIPLDADQWALNRWGAHFRINLEWSRLDAIPNAPPTAATEVECSIHAILPPASGSKLPPLPAQSDPELPPPDSYVKPLDGNQKDQKPASGGPAGIFSLDFPTKIPASPHEPTTARAPISPAPPSPGKPDLRNVVPADLKHTGRLLDLYDQAVARGDVTTSERDRLRFVAAAEHARAIGTKNPCGLFVRLVRGGLWSFTTQDDEDAARIRLKQHLYGSRPAPPPPPIAVPVERAADVLSVDAQLVRAVRAAAAQARYRGDAFPLLKRERPEWTRERWNAASAELERDALRTLFKKS
jgi:hypothetical protein